MLLDPRLDITFPPHRTHLPVDHEAIRPLWHCRSGCGIWPCPSERMRLRAAYDDDPVGLSVYMAGCLFGATGDLRRLDRCGMPRPDALFTRFVGWTRRDHRLR
ncbi:hypothetical protein [Micromonospora sp. WMMD980]|uniref:hypothetical protein n=1 Tax=Micromonospora sp. WMMD980 TaxID=3016088 RepID=UPI002416DE6D|nr:hypothetical protein [Micromonospora sp. WMMD980]MDG4799179.1 hypothetical protein [Micromonospora sp. WMMD980]